jgi:hypothetical protein
MDYNRSTITSIESDEKVGLTVVDILRTISDKKALALFETIALVKPSSDILIDKTQLTRKQYYSRMSNLMKSGLVKRKSRKYTLTSFGKVVYDIHIIIEKVITNYYWKLKAFDLVEVTNSSLSKEEHNKILDALIDNENIKQLIISK